MKALLDHDPLSGRSVVFHYDEAEDRMTIEHRQDVSHFLKMAADRRAVPEYTRAGIKRDFLHYAILPEVIQIEMRDKYGVDVNNRDHWPAVYKLINDVYPAFKTTNIKHNVKHG